MQVIFKIKAACVESTKVAVEEFNRSTEECITYGNSVPFNDDQKFIIEGEFLTYVGQRHPLWVNGGWLVIADSQGLTRGQEETVNQYADRVKMVKCVEHRTSIKEMLWHETVDLTLARLGERFASEHSVLFMKVLARGNSETYRAIKKCAPNFYKRAAKALAVFGWVCENDWVADNIDLRVVDLIHDPVFQKMSGYRKERYQKWFLKV